MRLGYTLIYVQNVQTTVEQYERCLGIARRFIHESGTYAEMETDSTTVLGFVEDGLAALSIPDYRHNRPTEPPAGIEIGFLTDDVPAAYERAVTGGMTTAMPPTFKPWGQTVAYVRDQNGVLIELCTPMG